MIPKIIHYCWLSGDEIPENLRKCMESWKEKLPDYEFIKWDLKNFNIDSSQWVKEAYQNQKYAFACDYIRLYAIYNYGGIYMDMDIEVLKAFDDLLNKPYMFAHERPNEEYIEAGCFGAEKGDFFISKCLEYYKNRHFIKEDGSYDLFPLPKIMLEIIKKNGINMDTYSSDYFTCKSYDTGIITTTKNTYTIHHFAGSWKTEKEQKIIVSTQKLSRRYGKWLARNFSEVKYTFEYDGWKGIRELFSGKISRRIGK